MKFTAWRKPVVLILVYIQFAVNAQSFAQQTYSLSGFSHNDYWRKRPFFDALSNGFTHIEADVYLRGRRLVVSHFPPFFRRRHTLDRLYIQPIVEYIQARQHLPQTSMDTLILMIDIKSRSRKTIQALRKMLEPYRAILSSSCNGRVIKRNLTIVLTGKRPAGMVCDETEQIFFIDEDLQRVNEDLAYHYLYPVASCRYSRILKWRGKGEISLKERMKLRRLVALAHRYGKKVRLWAGPEKQRVWQELSNCGVDLINTDKLSQVKGFLENNNPLFSLIK